MAFPPILNAIRESENKISEASKEIIYDATSLYVSNNESNFPKINGNVFCVTLNSLVQGEYLPSKVYDATSGNEIPLTNMVEVKYEQNRFSYNLNNECVEFRQKNLIDILLEQYNSDNTTGLVQDETNRNIYYYTGTNEEVANNFLWYGGHQWRVIEFDTNANTITLISQQPLTAIFPASSVWPTQGTYESSYINTWLNDYFYNSLDSSIQHSILDNTFNIGIYTDVDEITTIQKVGLLDEGQYNRAGGFDSYLDIKDHFWLGNRNSSITLRYVAGDGSLDFNDPLYAYGVRAVIKISDITITGGDGTLSSNYKTSDKATSTNDVQVGEYINVPYNGADNACGDDNLCTFRVVSKDNDSVKVILNGLLPSTSSIDSSGVVEPEINSYDSTNNNYFNLIVPHGLNNKEYTYKKLVSKNSIIYTPLNIFANNISSNYRYTGNKTFYIGIYTGNYNEIQSETLQSSVGLPTIGEMFSGNDIDVSTSKLKTFVDISTIENPIAYYSYWMMNYYHEMHNYVVDEQGTLNYVANVFNNGVRPVIYLKSGPSALTFTGGEGTAESPYELQ